MTFRRLLMLFIIGFGIAWIVSTFQDSPGYMDADYYYVTGLHLAKGFGFSEPFLWNFMDSPAGLPHPSHAYWMPLTSMLAAVGMFITKNYQFASAQLGFIFLAGFLPPLTAALSFALNNDKTWSTWAGLLAAFSGFYLAYLPTTDSFIIYMLLGAIYFLVLIKVTDFRYSSIYLGFLAGMMHLTRADGLIWLLIAISIAVSRSRKDLKKLILSNLLTLSGYLLVMLPWLLRNQLVFGTMLSPGGAKAFWFTTYDDLYSYPSGLVTISRWWSTGLGEIIQSRFWALGQNLQTAIGVQGGIFLAPLIMLGAWRSRENAGVRWGIITWLISLGVMTVVFPFAGARGGFFHSGAALQALMWALVPEGLRSFLRWGQQVRSWQKNQAKTFFKIAIICFAMIFSLFLGYNRIIGDSLVNPEWNRQYEKYTHIESALQEMGADSNDVVMVNNPPGFFAASARPSVAIPNGDIETSLNVARRYEIDYILLEFNHPNGLDQLYEKPIDFPGLRYIWSDGDTHIFAVESSP
ncbi:MAG: hypothetical protein ABFS03_07340 [Chloroflexota bacterium]